ncbi:MAG: hypothetical protein DRJ66_02340 [Thermoprotei archaeon]|nr:MAG: hypothetical protein DRJ66_02340 [Thermoprotei archaeon]RLF20272.1 MAG: hypothetical protein DRZ82_02930 [Thermoprotei archaeon]
MGIADPKKMEEYVKKLKRRKKELEEEFMNLLNKKEKGEITDKEYEERKRKLEREYVEIMDRLTQMSYLMGESSLF